MVGVVAFWLCFFCLCCTHIDLLVVQGLNFGVNGTISGERRGGEYGYVIEYSLIFNTNMCIEWIITKPRSCSIAYPILYSIHSTQAPS